MHKPREIPALGQLMHYKQEKCQLERGDNGMSDKLGEMVKADLLGEAVSEW